VAVGLNQQRKEERQVEYRIDLEALSEFIARQVALIEATPIPKLLADVVELRLRHESVGRDEVQALWLGAGLATHVGLAIFEEPERFITAGEPSPAVGGARRLTTRGGTNDADRRATGAPDR
jgi:hypothetical protein